MFERRVKVRRLRIALAVLAGLALVGTGVLGGVATALNWDGLLTPGPGWDDRYTIRSYDVRAELLDDGTVSVTEDIDVEWHEPRRGLIRNIEREAPGGEVEVTGIDVTSETQDDVWFEVHVDDPVGHDSVHLGEEFDFRPLGRDHYRISYDLHGLLVDWNGTATLRWDTFGDQWDTMIERATVTLDLPPGDHELACVVGAFGEAFACDGDGPTWSAQDLRPGRGITIEAQLDPEQVTADGLRRARLDRLREFSTAALQRLGLIVAITAAATLPLLGSIGSATARRRRELARERVETTGATYAPPRGMSPLTGAMLVWGESSAANDDQLFAAWLLDAQERDLIEVEPLGKDKGFRVRQKPSAAQPADSAEAAALGALAWEPGWVTWDKKVSQRRARRFNEAWQQLRSLHAGVAGVDAHVSPRIGRTGGLVVFGALVVAAILFFAFTPAAGIVMAVGAFLGWAAATYTDKLLRRPVADIADDRLDRWREVEGLRRFLEEAHADQISGLADDPNVPLTSPFLQLLPWVIAFGLGDRWAERFDAQIRDVTEGRGFYAPMRASQVAAVRSVARPASSSSSGGGSSGVGSGGGGGGGSSR